MFADEGATLYSAHLSWSNLWAQSLHVDLVLLPYYVLIHFWVMVSGTIAWVRALSLFAFCGTIVVAGGIGLRIAGRWCGVIAAALTATSTLLVLKSLNARPYELSAFLVAMCAALVQMAGRLSDSVVVGLQPSGDTGHRDAVVLIAAPVSMLVCVLGVRPRLIAQRLRACLHPLLSLRCLRRLDGRMHGEVGQVNWIAGDRPGALLLTSSRSGYRSVTTTLSCLSSWHWLYSSSRLSGLGTSATCRRRTDQSRPGHPCPHHRLGDPAHGRPGNRLVRPSDLFHSVRGRIGPRRALWWPSCACACSQRPWIQPALRMGCLQNAPESIAAFIWFVSSRRSLPSAIVGSARLIKKTCKARLDTRPSMRRAGMPSRSPIMPLPRH